MDVGFRVWRPVGRFGAVVRIVTRSSTSESLLPTVARGRGAARDVVWAQRAESVGAAYPTARAAGRQLPGIVLDADASIVIAHSDKGQAAPTFKGSFDRRRGTRRPLPVQLRQ